MISKTKIITGLTSLALSTCIFVGCDSDSVGGNNPIGNNESQEYYTQTNMSALEYQMYIAKNVSSATGQINTQISKIQNCAKNVCTPEDATQSLNSAISQFKRTKTNFTYVYPPDKYNDVRTNAINYFQKAIDEMNEAVDELSDGKITNEKALEISTRLRDVHTSIQSLNFTA